MRFNKHHVTDGTTKARCHYSLDNRCDGRSCVTIYDKDYGSKLAALFPNDSKNDSDSQTDYFETTRVVLFEDHPLYAEARERVEVHNQPRERKQAKAVDASEVEIVESLNQVINGTAYRHVSAKCGKHSASLTVATGAASYISVRVHNASHRAWKGIGKTFFSVEEALNNYRTPAIKAIIERVAA